MDKKKDFLLFCFLSTYAVFLYWFQINNLENFAIDWKETYYPAVTLLLHGQNPYQVPTLYNPIWSLIPLIPFALIGIQAGGAAMFFTAFFVYFWISKRLGGRPLAVLFFLLSPLIFYNLMLGNIDWLVLVGLVLPPPLGLFFLVLKPQIGFAPALYWMWVLYQQGGFSLVVKNFLPVAVCLATSFLVFGNFLDNRSDNLVTAKWNLSLFPWGVPFGLVLLYLSRNKINHAVSASAFFSPYLSLGTWSIAQLGSVDNVMFTFIVTVSLWVLFFAGRVAGY